MFSLGSLFLVSIFSSTLQSFLYQLFGWKLQAFCNVQTICSGSEDGEET